MTKQHCSRVFACAAALLACALGSFALAGDEARPLKIVVYHVLAAKGEEWKLPKELEKHRELLANTPFRAFEIAKKDPLSLETGKTVTSTLPVALGKAEITLGDDGRVIVTVLSPKKAEKLGSVRGPLPVVYGIERIQTQEGKQYFLIIEKAKDE